MSSLFHAVSHVGVFAVAGAGISSGKRAVHTES